MRPTLSVALLVAALAGPLGATNQFTTPVTAEELATAIASGIEGITMVPGSAQVVGPLAATSHFDDVDAGTLPDGTPLTLGQGIFLSSGPGNPLGGTTPTFSVQGDAELQSVLNGAGYSTSVTDVVSLSFRFTVQSGTTSIRIPFIFASKESYSSDWDIAAIFVDGTNYAFMPNGSILRVNPNANLENYSSPNFSGWRAWAPPQTTVGVLDGNLTEHTLRIAVADTGDNIVDSGIFIGRPSAGTDDSGGVIENNPPQAQPDAFAASDAAILSGNLLSDNGSGADSDPEGDPLAVVEVNGDAGSIATPLSLPSGALLTVNADGSFSYDPDGAFLSLAAGGQDTDSFTYKISDGGATASATVTITVTGSNDRPVAVDDSVNVGEDAGATADLVALLLGNDTDPDSGDVLSLSAIDASAAAGVVTWEGGVLTYDPNSAFETLAVGQAATDTFNYTVSDGGLSDDGTVTVTVNGANDPPQLSAAAVGGTWPGLPMALITDGLVVEPDAQSDYDGGRILIALDPWVAGDVLSLDGSPEGVASTSGGDASTLTINLGPAATPANVAQILAAVRYDSSAPDPSDGGAAVQREVSVVVDDGDGTGAGSAPFSNQVTGILTVNRAPGTPGLIGPVDHVDLPTSGRTLQARPMLSWRIPADADLDALHFRVFADTVAGTTQIADSAGDAAGFEFWNGSGWQPMTAAGVPSSAVDAPARYRPQGDLAPGNWSWTVQASDGKVTSPPAAVWQFERLDPAGHWNPVLGSGGRVSKAFVDQLRQEIDHRRRFRGLETLAWGESITANETRLRASHLTEMQSALAEALQAGGDPVPAWTPPTPFESLIEVEHFQALVDALE